MAEGDVNQMEWDEARIKRFWDYQASRQDLQSHYFTSQVGFGVVRFLAFAGDLRGRRVLDYGCGRGYLIPHLLDQGALVTGMDVSEASVATVNSAFAGKSGWEGAHVLDASPSAGPADFDMVCCLETIEHIRAERREEVLADIRRRLRPGGLAMLTTPNEENLREGFVYCPNCNSEYHRWQHQISWSAAALKKELETAGFETVFCQGVDLHRFQRPTRPAWIDTSLRDLWRMPAYVLARVLDASAPRSFPSGRVFNELVASAHRPHLVAVITKPGA